MASLFELILRWFKTLVENTFSNPRQISLDLTYRFSQHSTEIPGEVLFPQDGPRKITQLRTQMDEFHRFAEEDSCSIHGCQPSAGGGVGSAGRSLAQASASFAVFCDGRRTPRLRVLSLLRLCSDML